MTLLTLGASVALYSCSSEANDEPQVPGTTTTEAVKSQFAISIPYTGTAGSRQAEGVVQGQTTPQFRGMQSIKLIPYTLTTNASLSTSTAINGALTLASFTNSDFQANTTCKLYNNVTIPVGTNNFLFYAEGGASSETYTTAQNGTLKSSNFDDATSISAINFSLVPIKAEATTATQTTLLGIMNAVAGAKLSDNTTYWSSYVSSTDAVEKALGGYYTAFIGTKAGSATAIFNTLKILYDNLSGSTYTSNAMATY